MLCTRTPKVSFLFLLMTNGTQSMSCLVKEVKGACRIVLPSKQLTFMKICLWQVQPVQVHYPSINKQFTFYHVVTIKYWKIKWVCPVMFIAIKVTFSIFVTFYNRYCKSTSLSLSWKYLTWCNDTNYSYLAIPSATGLGWSRNYSLCEKHIH